MKILFEKRKRIICKFITSAFADVKVEKAASADMANLIFDSSLVDIHSGVRNGYRSPYVATGVVYRRDVFILY